MPEDSSDPRETRPGATVSEEWIAKIADEEGIDRNEVVQRLVSAYWTVKEMHGMLELTEEGIGPDGGLESLDIEALQSDAVTDDLEDIETRLEQLETANLDREARSSATDERADEDEIGRHLSEVEDSIESLDERLSAVEARFDDEFENLETILDYLIDSTDSLETAVDSIGDDHQVIRRRQAEHERLVDLKRLASKLGVRTGKCEYCNTSVEIALLPTPECPNCGRSITDIEPSDGWFGLGTNTLTVARGQYVDGPGEYVDGPFESETSRDRTEEGVDNTTEADGTDGFRWGTDAF